MAIPRPARMTWDEYLRFEQAADVRHEFRAGDVVAMAGGTYEHSLIIANFARALGNALDGKPCHVLESNMLVRVRRADQGLHPDVTVVCGEPAFDDNGRDRTALLNPRLLVEVLSPSTADDDRTVKFDLYCQIPGFEEYVLVEHRLPRVETRRRLPDGGWRLDAATGTDATILLASLGVTLRLADIYREVRFTPAPAAAGQ